ncbi:protein FAR1-RELATED SEQUENCE 5-like [Rutidosis leptorrhynchoides]|uniref:protein FAR1-RELATED SEQUENCE 5-like n=1 Tax=Rutidosis leptorrhynchoides TaxID=125765 RepID=UPI003A9975DC
MDLSSIANSTSIAQSDVHVVTNSSNESAADSVADTFSSTNSVCRNHFLSSYEDEGPDGKKLWFPNVPDHFNPVIGSVLRSLEDCLYFYDLYAEAAGFNIKKASKNKDEDGSVIYQVYRCNRSGRPVPKPLVPPAIVNPPANVNASQSVPDPDSSIPNKPTKRKRQRRKVSNRKSSSIKVECEACIRFKLIEGKIVIFKFFEGHSHKLITERNRNLLNKRRKLDPEHMKFLFKLSTQTNMGGFKAHTLFSALSGGIDNVGPLPVDFNNFHRDLIQSLGDTDAHIAIEQLLMKKNTLPNFSVEYYCDHNDFLRGVFWADNISKLNYKEFGDIVGFDATYGTNMYNMIFVPLTGVDNHKKLVGRELFSNKDFRKQMNNIFWNQELNAEKFEKCWQHVLDEFGLHDVDWFKDIYAMKEKWIPCFFRDTPMPGLMRTSSLCESENSFFIKCKNKHSKLVEFFSPFDVVVEKQRHNNMVLEFEMDNRSINCVTNKLIELHARDFYTPTMFLLVQEEIFQSSFSCVQISSTIEENEGKQLCVIEEKFPPPRLNWKYRVTFDVKTAEASCSCLLFTREGRLCRHIFYVYHVHDVVAIPMVHLLRRWSKEVSETFNSIFVYSDDKSESKKIINHVFNKLRKVSSLYRDDLDKLVSFRDKFNVLIGDFLGSTSDEPSTSTRGEHINRLWGFSKPVNSNIRAPENIRNKGQRRSNRILSSKEVAVKKHVKPRACKRCGILGHNVRTCTTDLTQLHNSKNKEKNVIDCGIHDHNVRTRTTDLTQLHNSNNKGKNVIDFELEDESEEDDEDVAYEDEDSDSD